MVRLRTFNRLLKYFENDTHKTKKWLSTPHKSLDGIKPVALAEMGKHKKLDRFVIDFTEGNL